MRVFFFIIIAILSSLSGYSQVNQSNDSIPKILDEVAVTSTKKSFSNKNGNLKLDVANSVYKAIPNTLDLLAKFPKIQIAPDKESISVVGKGVPIIYIDNQKVGLNDLNSLSVDDIKSIEMVNNPSAKYEAEGKVVILITKKISKKEGFKVAISENASFKKYFSNYLGMNSSLKKKKVEFKANFNYNQLGIWESNGNDFLIPSQNIISNYLVVATIKRPQFVFGSGVYYKINEDDYFSFNFNGRSQKEEFKITTDTYMNASGSEDYINTLSKNLEKRNFSNIFLNYNHKIKNSNGQLFAGFQYSNFNQKTKGVVYDQYNDLGFQFIQNTNQDFSIDVLSGRTDFEKTFKNQMKLELGALYLQANANTGFISKKSNPVNDSNTEYNLMEKNIAGYTQWSGSIKKVTYSLGLRAEQTNVKGKYLPLNTISTNKNYIDLFPKMEVAVSIDSSKTITFNYSKSIVRPKFSATSQTSAYVNPYFMFANNINLEPTISNEVSTSFQYKKHSLKMSYHQNSKPVFYGSEYNELQNLLILKPLNFDKESGFDFEITSPLEYKFWTTTNTMVLILNKIEDKTAFNREVKPYLYYSTTHSFKLPKEIELVVSAWGMTQQYEGIFHRKAVFTVDMTLSKKVFQKLDCTLSWNDIFRKENYYDDFSMNSVTAKGKYFTDTHAVSLAVKYSFGKIKDSEFKQRDIDENSSRIK